MKKYTLLTRDKRLPCEKCHFRVVHTCHPGAKRDVRAVFATKTGDLEMHCWLWVRNTIYPVNNPGSKDNSATHSHWE